MRRLSVYLLLLVAGLLLMTGTAAAQNCTFTLFQPNGGFVGSSGGTFIFQFSATPGNCAWAASSTVDWITVSTTSGAGGSSLTVLFTVGTNGGTAARQGDINLTSGSSTAAFRLYENAASCTFGLSQSSFSFPITGGNGSANVTTNGSDCQWIILNAPGWITGLPGVGTTGNGSFGFTVAANATFDRSVQLQLYGGPTTGPNISVSQTGIPQIVNPVTLSTGAEGETYAPVTFGAVGGSPGYTWSATGLPTGLSISAGGLLSGTPAAGTQGDYSVVVRVTDTSQSSSTATYALRINPPLAITGPASLGPGAVGETYAPVTFSGSGGLGTYAWSATGLPNGLTLSATGVLSGTPGAGSNGTYQVVARLADAGTSRTVTLPLVINPALVITGPTSLATGAVGEVYGPVTFAGAGGLGGYEWSATGLPNGLGMSAAGVLGGTPAPGSQGTYRVTARLADAGASVTAVLTLVIDPTLSITGPTSLNPGAVGEAYGPLTFTGAGGVGTYVWSATGLPGGLSLSNAGVLSGTPAAGLQGTYPVTVRLADAGAAVTVVLSLVINGALNITGPAFLSTAAVGEAYGQVAFTASGGVGTNTWTATGLPNGLSLSSSGVLNGTPAANTQGTYSVNVRVADAGTAVTVGLPLVINPALTISGPASLGLGAVGEAYGPVTFTATGGLGNYSWSATGLPGGLSLSSSGVLSGTPAANTQAAYSVSVRVADAGTNATVTLPLTINPPLGILTSSIPNGIINTAYSRTVLQAQGGTPPYVWSASGLPPGMSLSTDGVLGGAATSSGPFSPVVTVHDSFASPQTAQQTYHLVIAPQLVLTTTAMPNGVVNAPYPGVTMQAQGGTPPFTWSATGLPPGLTINPSTGAITGTGSMPGPFRATITVGDVGTPTPQSATQTYSGIIYTTLVLSTASMPNGVANVSYSAAVTAAGGTAPYTWSIIAGVLPAGLTLNASTGVISGVPAAGPFGYTVQVTDTSVPAQVTARSYSGTIYSTLHFTGTSLPNGAVGSSYSASIAAEGGAPPYTWMVASGSLPPGLSLENGTISGKPTTAGNYGFTVQAQDQGTPKPQVSSGTYNITIATSLVILTTALPNGTVGTAYSAGLAADKGQQPYTWSVSGGSLPPGLSLTASTGAITGKPATAGSYSFLVEVADSTAPPQRVSASLSVLINGALTITTGKLPDGTAGQPYSAGLAAQQGKQPYSWSIGGGSLPPGLSLDPATGTIAGTSANAGQFGFTVQVSDSSSPPLRAVASLGITMVSGLAITTTSVPGGVMGTPYSASIGAQNGVLPYTWSISGGSLPPGLGFNSSNGSISGTPAGTGSFSFTVKVADSSAPPVTASQSFSTVINSATPSITTTTLANGMAGTAYTASLSAQGGNTPYTWTISSGSLPAGLSLNSASGAISGTPNAASTFHITVQVTDKSSPSQSATQSYSVTIYPVLEVVTVAADGLSGVPYSAKLAAQGGLPPYTWSVTAATLPPGISFDATGLTVRGTPTRSGAYQIELNVKDNAGYTASRTLSVNIGPQPDLSLTGLDPTQVPTLPTSVGVKLGAPSSQAVSGTLQVSFQPNAAGLPGAYRDPALQFAAGGASIPFTIPAGTSTAVLDQSGNLQQGTVAGDITVTMVPPLAAPKVVTVPRLKPVITTGSVRITSVTSSGFRVELSGYSTPRDLASATFTFTAAPGSEVNGASITMDLRDAMTQWFASGEGRDNGSLFHLAAPFTLQGDIQAVQSVSVTLTNSAGTSDPATGSQ